MKFWIASSKIGKELESWKENIQKWLHKNKYTLNEHYDQDNAIIYYELNSKINITTTMKIENNYVYDGNLEFNEKKINKKHVEDLNGDFTIALLDNNNLILHNSKYSTKSIYYYIKDNSLFASNDIRFLLCSDVIPYNISSESCKKFCTSSTQILDVFYDSQKSFFENINQIPINTTLEKTDCDCKITKNKWKPTNKNNPKLEYSDFRSLLNKVIENKVVNEERIGIELSGGLDSALILATLIDIGYKPQNIYAFCMSFKDETMHFSNDEEIVKKLIEDFKINGYIIYAEDTLHFWNLNNEKMNNIDGPATSANLFIGETFDSLCSTLGIDILLTGDGGDNILSGNMYVLDQLFKRNPKLVDQIFKKHVNKKKLVKKWKYVYKPVLNIGYYKELWKEDNLLVPYYFLRNQKKIEKKMKKKDIYNLNKSKYLKGWMKRYMYDFLFPKSTYLKDINSMTEYFHPLYDNRIINIMFSLTEEKIYDIYGENEYVASKQVIRKGYSDILPKYIIKKSIKTSYGAMNRKRFLNDQNKLLLMFHPENSLHIDKYSIVNRNEFYNVLKAVIAMTDDETMLYNLNVRMIEGIINLELWLSIATKGRAHILEISKIKRPNIYGDVHRIGD